MSTLDSRLGKAIVAKVVAGAVGGGMAGDIASAIVMALVEVLVDWILGRSRPGSSAAGQHDADRGGGRHRVLWTGPHPVLPPETAVFVDGATPAPASPVSRPGIPPAGPARGWAPR